MNIQLLKSFFMWSATINFGVLILWFLAIAAWKESFYKLQTRWFPMSKERLIVCNYVMYGLYKLAIILFNLVPWLVLSILA